MYLLKRINGLVGSEKIIFPVHFLSGGKTHLKIQLI